MTNHLFRHM